MAQLSDTVGARGSFDMPASVLAINHPELLADNADDDRATPLQSEPTNGDVAKAFEDEDPSSDEEDEIMIKIGDIKSNVPYQKTGVGGVGPTAGKLDMDQTAEIDGKPIYDIDIAGMVERPWRKPGADITDYFNYGFTEETWNIYCERQKKLRSEFGPQQANKMLFNQIALNSNPQIGAPLIQTGGGQKTQQVRSIQILGGGAPAMPSDGGGGGGGPKLVVNLADKFRNQQASLRAPSSISTIGGSPPSGLSSASAAVSAIPTLSNTSTISIPDMSAPPPSSITVLGGGGGTSLPPPQVSDFQQPPPSSTATTSSTAGASAAMTVTTAHPVSGIRTDVPPPSMSEGPPGVEATGGGENSPRPPGADSPAVISAVSVAPAATGAYVTASIARPIQTVGGGPTNLPPPPVNMSVPPPGFNPMQPPPTVRMQHSQGLPANMHLPPPGVPGMGAPPILAPPGLPLPFLPQRFGGPPPPGLRPFPHPQSGYAGFVDGGSRMGIHHPEDRSPASYSDRSSGSDDEVDRYRGDRRDRIQSPGGRSRGFGPRRRRSSRSPVRSSYHGHRRVPPAGSSSDHRRSGGSRHRQSRSRSRSGSPHERSRRPKEEGKRRSERSSRRDGTPTEDEPKDKSSRSKRRRSRSEDKKESRDDSSSKKTKKKVKEEPTTDE